MRYDKSHSRFLVALDPDVAAVFSTAEAVNGALRTLIEGMVPALPDAV